jgi:hypothetical protein
MAIATTDITQAIWDTAHRIESGVDILTSKAKAYVKAEKIYRIALATEIVKLKTAGMPVTIINDVARGNTAELKYNRDLAEELYKTCKEMLESLRAELTGLQSILKVQSDI